MPTQRDPTTMQSAKKFCEDFLDAGGLSLIVNILQKDCIGPDVDYETRQGCYAISLQLLRSVSQADQVCLMKAELRDDIKSCRATELLLVIIHHYLFWKRYFFLISH